MVRFVLVYGFLLAGWLGFAGTLQAQLGLQLELARTAFMQFEPMIVDVKITNLSGRDLRLEDGDHIPWFGFNIQSRGGTPVLPRQRNYSMPPVEIGVGQTLTRQVNLTPLYSLDQLGSYRIRAMVYMKDQGQYYNSNPVAIEITDGSRLWQREVGSPEDGSIRQVTVLSHIQRDSTSLYLRIRDREAGRVYCTHRLGPLLTFGSPEVELDLQNQVHVLHLRAPKIYIYSHIGLNGEIIQRRAYQETSSKPALRRAADGSIAVVGGEIHDPEQIRQEKAAQPGLSDRPVPLPTSQPRATPTPKPKGGPSFWPFKKKEPSE